MAATDSILRQIEVRGEWLYINGIPIKFDTEKLAEEFLIKFLIEWQYR
jgi:hypothetical protein